MTEILTHEQFAPHVNKDFRFKNHPQPLRLVKLQLYERAPLPEIERRPFLLIFQGPREGVMPEGFYTAAVEGGPSFDFYVMPIHTVARDHQDYQAVFN